MKIFENVEIKNFISIVAVLVWVGLTAYGCVFGDFEKVFEFGTTIIMMVFSFFLGRTSAKSEAELEAAQAASEETESKIIVTETSALSEHID